MDTESLILRGLADVGVVWWTNTRFTMQNGSQIRPQVLLERIPRNSPLYSLVGKSEVSLASLIAELQTNRPPKKFPKPKMVLPLEATNEYGVKLEAYWDIVGQCLTLAWSKESKLLQEVVGVCEGRVECGQIVCPNKLPEWFQNSGGVNE
jgi:hypothetical protein